MGLTFNPLNPLLSLLVQRNPFAFDFKPKQTKNKGRLTPPRSPVDTGRNKLVSLYRYRES